MGVQATSPYLVPEQGHEPWTLRSSPDTESARAVIMDFPDSRTVGNEFWLFMSHSVYVILL